MADPETLAALKRAYADTILNTTKEAAARVLVSEKKARRYQQEIVTVRDEAIHTLLRLKQMFDSKVKETELVSMKQQQKVEELEAQLEEAEDIVGELRMELRELHDELKKVKNAQTYLNNGHEEDFCKENRDAAVSLVPGVSCIPVEKSGSVVANELKIPSLTRVIGINRCSSKDNKDRCHHTLPSILKKRREAQVCTQVIDKVDISMANVDLSSTVEVGNKKNGVGVCIRKVPSCKTLEMSGCDFIIPSVRDGEEDTMVSPKTSSSEQEKVRKSAIGESEAMKEENIDVSASPLHEETSGLAVNKNRCIKYTFKRKRKKEGLSNLKGDSTIEESKNKKQKNVEKDDGYMESLKPSFTIESSRDSLRVTHLARQLVPFSEKKGLMQN